MITRWYNLKATLSVSGEGVTAYHYFVLFTVRNNFQNFFLYIFHGVSPSPRVEVYFIPQYFGKVNSNNFIHRSLGRIYNTIIIISMNSLHFITLQLIHLVR